MAKLQNQIAIITGSSSGIGAAVAKSMAEEGATVVINYPVDAAQQMAEAVKNEIIAAGGKAIMIKADVSKEAEVQQMFADTIKQFGTVDILVNNAGLQKDAHFENMTLDQWNFVIGVNLTGQFLCAREAIREFLRRGVDEKKSKAAGKIFCMSSVHEVIPWAGHANYAASKGGKAQERSFPELNGMTCGLLTHAFLRSLEETPPDSQNGVSSTAIKQYLLSTWADVCGSIPAVEPEFISPTGPDIQFSATSKQVLQGFKLTKAPATAIRLDISDALRVSVVQCYYTPTAATVTWTGQAAIPLVVSGLRFFLKLQPGLYRCVVSGDMQKSVPFEATGVTDVDI